MYAYIKGEIVDLTPEYAVIDVGGIGYKIYIPVSLYAKGLKREEEVLLYTTQVVREDDIRLFGFLEAKEREFFEKLISLSGVGAKTALTLLGHLGCNDLHLAIQTQDVTTLVRVPGIGKKTAERIIVELADRIAKWAGLLSDQQRLIPTVAADALSALINLGYQAAVAQKAIHRVVDKKGESIPLGEMISSALKEI